MVSTVTKAVAYGEVGLAVLLTVVSLASFHDLQIPETDLHARYTEWTPLVLMLAVPLAVSFWLSGLALIRGWRSRWIMQLVPAVTIVCVVAFLWWADNAAR